MWMIFGSIPGMASPVKRISVKLLCIVTFRLQLTLVWILALLDSASCSVTPRNPKIKYCVSYWAKNITCYWDDGPEMHLQTTYTLHITEQAGRCRRDFGYPRKCIAIQGDHSCGIPIDTFFAFYKIKVTAENQLTRASSSEECIHGMSIVKLSPPEVTMLVAHQSHCFQLEWHLPGDEILSATEAQYEIRYQDVAEMSWTQVNFSAIENDLTFANICGASPFTNYSVQVRAKYLLDSSLTSDWVPFWSDWSLERFVRTLPTVPSQGPALWRKLGPPGADGKREVVLMWKPLPPKEANGKILSYSLHSQRKGQLAIPECLTQDLQCTLFLPAGEGFTFFITATNSAGTSPPTKLIVPPFGGQEEPLSPLLVQVSPVGNHSLLLQWSHLSFPNMSYVIEWGRIPKKPGSDICWHYQPGTTSHVVITEAIEPGYLYGLKIFGLIDDSVWALDSTSAYSKQIAPLRAPTLYPTQVWKSHLELQWEKIPLEDQGGVIRNYTICYEEEGKGDKSMVVLDSSIYCYLIEGLSPGSIIRVSITVTNEGGSTKGPTLSIRTKNYDYSEVELMFSILCVGFLLLLLAGSLACLCCKHQLLQNYLWPPVPDPAKSNLATWMPENKCLDFSPRFPRSQDFLSLTISNLLRVLPSKQEEPEPNVFLGKTWLMEVSSAYRKYSHPAPIIRSGTVQWEHREQFQKHTGNEVEYSRIVVLQKSCSLDHSSSGSHHHWSLSRHQDPASSCSGLKSGNGVWLQNLTYEALLDVSSHNITLESTPEFPLLVDLVAVEGALQPPESPYKGPPIQI